MVHSFRRSQGAWSVGASAPASANSESSKGAATGDPPASPRSCRLPSMSIDSSGAAARTGTDPAPSSPSSSLKRRRRLDDRKAGPARAGHPDEWTLAAWPQSAHFFPLRVCGRRRSHGAPEAAARGPSSTPPILWLASSLIRGCYHRHSQGMPKPGSVARNRAHRWHPDPGLCGASIGRASSPLALQRGLDQRPRLLERLPLQLAERRRVRAATRQVRHDHQRQVRRDLGLERDERGRGLGTTGRGSWRGSRERDLTAPLRQARRPPPSPPRTARG